MDSADDMVDSNSGSDDDRATKKKASKKKASAARTRVQVARSANSNQKTTVGKRKLEADGHVKENMYVTFFASLTMRSFQTCPSQSCPLISSTKKTKKPEVGGLNTNWEEHRHGRGRPISVGSSTNTKCSSRAHSNTSTGSALSSNIDLTLSDTALGDPVDGDGIQFATFADNNDSDERSAMADVIEDARSELIKRKLRRQADKVGALGGMYSFNYRVLLKAYTNIY